MKFVDFIMLPLVARPEREKMRTQAILRDRCGFKSDSF